MKGFRLVDFWAEWCPSCLALAPTVDAMAERFPGLEIDKVDVAADPEKSAVARIRGLPTLIVERDGIEVARRTGSVSSSVLAEWLDGIFQKDRFVDSD